MDTDPSAAAIKFTGSVPRPGQPATYAVQVADAYTPPINILIVDDEPKNLTVLETVLDHPGYRLVRAGSADEALLALVVDEFALLILDIRMPNMTGIELAQMIRGRRKTAHVPIIFLTAYYNEDQHVLEGYGTGAVDYLLKPVNPVVLRSKVAVFAALHRKDRECGTANRALLAEVDERRRTQEQLRELNETLEQRVAERTQALAESEERYRVLFSALPVAAYVCDRNATIQYFNSRAVELWQREPDIGVDRYCGSKSLWLNDGTLLPHEQSPMVEVMRTGVPARNVELLMERPDGSRLAAIVNVAALVDAQGETVGAVTSFDDMTERKRVELALAAASAEAERANQAKSEFLLRMSHELRSPLGSMLGFTQLIEAGTPAPTPAQQDSVEHILDAGWYLLGLINEVLDLTSIESGKIVVLSQAISLNEVLDDCRAMIESRARENGIDIHFSHFEQPCFVQADATRTKQVLMNLLTNAIKYNRSPGRIDLHCTAAPGEPVRVSVQDTGHGLSTAQMAQLFEPFNRLGQESGTKSGTGIGLVISKRLVELMGGRIGVDSTVGVGSCVWFELDAAPPVAATDSPANTVLCIDGDGVRLQQVQELLAGWPGVCVLRARDIRSGVEMARSARPDLILVGVAQPDPGAVQARLLLAKDPVTAHIPVIAMGGDAGPGGAEADLAASFFGDLTDPVQREAFVQTLELALQRTRAGGQRATAKENKG